MEKLSIEQMACIDGGGQMRDCMLDGALATLGVATFMFGGWAMTAGALAHGASIGCFD